MPQHHAQRTAQSRPWLPNLNTSTRCEWSSSRAERRSCSEHPEPKRPRSFVELRSPSSTPRRLSSSRAKRKQRDTADSSRLNSRAEGRRSPPRSEEHTSELQSLRHLVCRL